jgi:hypothetical protein
MDKKRRTFLKLSNRAGVSITSEGQVFTLPEMKQADSILSDLYIKALAQDRYKTSFYHSPHKFDIDMQEEAIAWFDKWLK